MDNVQTTTDAGPFSTWTDQDFAAYEEFLAGEFGPMRGPYAERLTEIAHAELAASAELHAACEDVDDTCPW